MKLKIVICIFILSAISCFAQKGPGKTRGDEQIRVFRQTVVSDLENKVKDVPLVTVRSLVRYQIASFLWKNGKDDTGYAKDLAVKALEELHEKQAEATELHYSTLQSEIIALLEARSPETAKRLLEKYQLGSEEALDSAFSLFDQSNGEKLVADKLMKYFEDNGEISLTVSFLIDELLRRKSPELLRVLSGVLGGEESGRSNLPAESFTNLVDVFRSPLVTSNLRTRFYLAAMKQAQGKLSSGETDLQNEFNLINSLLPDIASNAPNLSSDAVILKVLLNSVLLRHSDEYDEAFARIDESADKLAATIAEAEAAENRSLKVDLYIDAMNLAVMKEKPQIALEVLEKLADIKRGEKERLDRFYSWYDQCLGDIVGLALKTNNVDLGKLASNRTVDKLSRATNLRKVAEYYFEKQDLDSASITLQNSLKIANDADNSSRKIGVLLRLILAFNKIDKIRVPGTVETTAKCIDSIPSLNPEDKPESEKYKQHIMSILAIDINLLPAFSELLKTNRTEALNLASRINKKEVKIITSYALMVDSLTVPKVEISQK